MQLNTLFKKRSVSHSVVNHALETAHPILKDVGTPRSTTIAVATYKIFLFYFRNIGVFRYKIKAIRERCKNVLNFEK